MQNKYITRKLLALYYLVYIQIVDINCNRQLVSYLNICISNTMH